MKIKDRLADLFTQNQVKVNVNVDALLTDIPVVPEMFPEIIRRADALVCGIRQLRVAVALNEQNMSTDANEDAEFMKFKLISGSYDVLAAKLLHINELSCETVTTNESERLRVRFDEIPFEAYRKQLIVQFLNQNNYLSLPQLVSILSVSQNYLNQLLRDETCKEQ